MFLRREPHPGDANTVQVWSLALGSHKCNPHGIMGRCLHVNQIHSKPWISHRAHLFILYEKVSTPCAGIFSRIFHYLLVSQLEDKPNPPQKVAGGHGIRVRQAACRMLWLVSHLQSRDRPAWQAAAGGGQAALGDTDADSCSESHSP